MPQPISETIGPVVPASEPTSVALLEDPSAPRLLKPTSSRLGVVIVLGLFAVVWNGFILVDFFTQLWSVWRGRGGVFSWGHLLFLTPFVVIGLVLAVLAGHQFLALFNPKAEVTIKPGVPMLGGILDLSWQLTGRTHLLRKLLIQVEAREEATHRQGTRSSTDRKSFLKLEVATIEAPAELATGQGQVTLPADTVPSFKSANNRIVWAVRLKGEIPRWPDLQEEFEIWVRPAGFPQGS